MTHQGLLHPIPYEFPDEEEVQSELTEIETKEQIKFLEEGEVLK